MLIAITYTVQNADLPTPLSTAPSQLSGTHYHLLSSFLVNLSSQHRVLKLVSKSWPTDYSFLLSQFCLSTLERIGIKIAKVAVIFKLKLNLMHLHNSPLRSPPPPPYSLRHYDPHNYLPIICKTHFFSTSFYPMQQPSNYSPQILGYTFLFQFQIQGEDNHLLITSSTNSKLA